MPYGHFQDALQTESLMGLPICRIAQRNPRRVPHRIDALRTFSWNPLSIRRPEVAFFPCHSPGNSMNPVGDELRTFPDVLQTFLDALRTELRCVTDRMAMSYGHFLWPEAVVFRLRLRSPGHSRASRVPRVRSVCFFKEINNTHGAHARAATSAWQTTGVVAG